MNSLRNPYIFIRHVCIPIEFMVYFGRVLHLRDIHYGIIGFVGIVLGLVYFLIENLCFTLGIHCFLLEIIENHR